MRTLQQPVRAGVEVQGEADLKTRGRPCSHAAGTLSGNTRKTHQSGNSVVVRRGQKRACASTREHRDDVSHSDTYRDNSHACGRVETGRGAAYHLQALLWPESGLRRRPRSIAASYAALLCVQSRRSCGCCFLHCSKQHLFAHNDFSFFRMITLCLFAYSMRTVQRAAAASCSSISLVPQGGTSSVDLTHQPIVSRRTHALDLPRPPGLSTRRSVITMNGFFRAAPRAT